jgi:hypothetical protein
MPDGVDTRVEAAKPARLEAALNRLPAKAQLDQLVPGHDAVLPAREGRELRLSSRRPFDWQARCTISVTLVCHAAMLSAAA